MLNCLTRRKELDGGTVPAVAQAVDPLQLDLHVTRGSAGAQARRVSALFCRQRWSSSAPGPAVDQPQPPVTHPGWDDALEFVCDLDGFLTPAVLRNADAKLRRLWYKKRC